MVRVRRSIKRTLRIVGEGYAEQYFLEHLRATYLRRTGSISLKITNARGKGGKAVLDHALRPQIRAGFDSIAVLVDTDQDWNDAQRCRAKNNGIVVLESDPCLERVLLEIHGTVVTGSSRQLKREFNTRFGLDAHDVRVYQERFKKATIDLARKRIAMLDQLLKLPGQ